MKNRFPLSLLAALLCASYGSTAFADATDGTLYYTTYNGGQNIWKVDYAFDGASTFTLAPSINIASTNGADGIVFNPNNGNLLIGGQGNAVHEITKAGAPVATATPGVAAFHLSVDPSKTIVWAAGIPGQLSALPLTPSVTNGVPYTMLGAESGIDTIAWNGSTALYTSSGSGGHGWYGTIVLDTVLKTATTTRVAQIDATHGATFDPFTGDFILIGDQNITQVDGVTLAIVSDLLVPSVSTFDQGTVDGKGHGFFADNGGNLVFLDYSNSGLVADVGNFRASPFLANFLDDVAPIVGPGGSNNTVPESSSTLLCLALVLPALFLAKRRMGVVAQS
ncbi:MAG: hypothetical protein ABI680_08450 [Chthoniobacteraceae bacterium]